jgi:hypothetical protein
LGYKLVFYRRRFFEARLEFWKTTRRWNYWVIIRFNAPWCKSMIENLQSEIHYLSLFLSEYEKVEKIDIIFGEQL